ncbi:MAG: hypothetical protein GTN70_10640 [Deltaproteobacteria bacterium]|nr:hypothetical protein [Deltaproteobacteria bacterium]NIS78232.1 hypothetical protein [Deltaproteobacteria bacterium]
MSIKWIRRKGKYTVLLCALLFATALFIGCDDGDDGKPGSSAGTLSGTVTVEDTSIGIPDVTISTEPDIQGDITTDASGNYSATLPIGVYQVTYTRDNFGSATESVSIVAEANVVRNVELSGQPVVVIASAASGAVSPGDPVSLSATVEALDGSTIQSILWEQSSSAPVQDINPPDALATTVTLGTLDAYRDELFTVLTEPPISEAQLPPDIELPESGFVGGLQDRFQVVGLDPFSLEEAALVTMKVTVTTSSGPYHDEVEIHATLPWKVTTGVNNVPIGIPVLMHGGTVGGTQSSWDWTLTPASGSSATLDDGTLQNPTFTPDVDGTYTVAEANSGTSIDVYAGTWEGIITGQDSEGRPEASNCIICHPTVVPDWAKTGHAVIFTDNMNNPSGHWRLSCAGCHGVGYDTAVDNDGWDEAIAAEGWVVPDPGPGVWADILDTYPDTARLSNIQCENCHGPQNSSGLPHSLGHSSYPARLSLASEVCASCHGEPLRHGRFQQWQLSHHADYAVAIDEGQRTDCARCHTANGFLAWGEEADWGDQELSAITWTEDETHPQTCVTCHDPHAVGTTTGTGTDATTRVFDDTPVLAAGWSASGVGNGAICMTCHNTRRGLYNDAAAAAGTVTFSDGRAPHGGAQGDMVMGQNAFFVTIGARGPHSIIDDTCVNCHMEKSPPPALLSYNQGGSNHTFEASIDICSECHTSINGDALHDAIEAEMERLIDEQELAIAELMNAQLASTDITLFDSARRDEDAAVVAVISLDSSVTIANFGESHGRMSMDVNDGTTTYENVQLRRVAIGNNTVFDSGDNLFASYEEGVIILKAGWNILMVENDGSHGIHNPPFATSILGAAGNVLSTTDFTTATPVP